ncbi:hypothetical protein LTDYDHKI_CDS0024 [Exiguobacterium phage phiExGM16]
MILSVSPSRSPPSPPRGGEPNTAGSSATTQPREGSWDTRGTAAKANTRHPESGSGRGQGMTGRDTHPDDFPGRSYPVRDALTPRAEC